MNQSQKISLFFLRLTMGFLYLYAGVTKVINPEWSAAGYLKGAKFMSGFYASLAHPAVLPFINFVNEWGLTLLGIALLAGFWVRGAALFGVVLMILYYLPLGIVHPNAHSLIVDEHVIYAAALLVLAGFGAGEIWGADGWLRKRSGK